MASETVPLLEARQGSVATALSSLSGFVRRMQGRWSQALGKIADGLMLLLAPVGFGCSAYLLASTESGSVCKTINAGSLFEVVLQVMPMFLALVILAMSDLIRVAIWPSQPFALSVIEVIAGITLMEWMSVCVFGASAWVALTAGTVVAAGAIAVWMRR